MTKAEHAALRCKFLTYTRQLALTLIPSKLTEKDIEKFTEAVKDDPDFDKLMDMLIGISHE